MKYKITYVQEVTHEVEQPDIAHAAVFAKAYANENKIGLRSIYRVEPAAPQLTPGLTV